MALILSIESSSPQASLALHKSGELCGVVRNQTNQDHYKNLPLLLKELLFESGHTHTALSAIATSSGPGSYTGLRIGAAFSKGLAWALEIPLIGIGTLDNLLAQGALLCPQAYSYALLNAKRGRAYGCLASPEGQKIYPIHSCYVSWERLPALPQGPILFLGTAIEPLLANPPLKREIEIKEAYPDATAMGQLAYRAYIKNHKTPAAYLEPSYQSAWQGDLPLFTSENRGKI